MLAVEPSKIKTMQSLFPGLAEGLIDYTNFKLHGYASFAISVFDHWLSNDEATALIPSFEGPLHNSRNRQRFSCLRPLADEAFLIQLNESNLIGFYTFESEQEKDELITKAIYEEELITLCIPNRSTILAIGHDYTDYIYYNSDIAQVSSIQSACKDRGLYCLTT